MSARRGFSVGCLPHQQGLKGRPSSWHRSKSAFKVRTFLKFPDPDFYTHTQTHRIQHNRFQHYQASDSICNQLVYLLGCTLKSAAASSGFGMTQGFIRGDGIRGDTVIRIHIQMCSSYSRPFLLSFFHSGVFDEAEMFEAFLFGETVRAGKVCRESMY